MWAASVTVVSDDFPLPTIAFVLIGYGREPVRQVLPRGCAIFHINGIFAGTDKDAFSCLFPHLFFPYLSKHAGNNNFFRLL